VFITQELEIYNKNRPKSKVLWQKALQTLPGGVSHTIRTFGLSLLGTFPVFIKSGNGQYLKDGDDNMYLDCWNGHFAMILGHNHIRVREAIQERLMNGWHFGTNTNNQIELASTLIQNNPGIKKLRFCSSGTEATMYAIRLARAFTKRRLVAKAKLGWHGANDTLFYDVGGLIGVNSPPGLPSKEEAGVITFDVNDENTFELIKKNAKNLAAVIVEPVIGGGGGFPLDHEYLKRLREETEKNGILLIFDEIITGYRFNYGLFQNDLKILPDITTMGKILGGGLPLGVVGGREEIINTSSYQMENPVIIGGGTFSGHPLSMTAGLKTLEILKDSGQDYHRINQEGDKLLNNLNRFFCDLKFPIVATGYKSIVMLHVLSEWIESPSIHEIIKYTDKKREALLHLALFNRNILGLHGLGSISMAFNHENIIKLQNTVEEIAEQISKSPIDI